MFRHGMQGSRPCGRYEFYALRLRCAARRAATAATTRSTTAAAPRSVQSRGLAVSKNSGYRRSAPTSHGAAQQTPRRASQSTQTPPCVPRCARIFSVTAAAATLPRRCLTATRSRRRSKTCACHFKCQTVKGGPAAYLARSSSPWTRPCAPSFARSGNSYATTFCLRRRAHASGNAAKSSTVAPAVEFSTISGSAPCNATRSVHSPRNALDPAARALKMVSESMTANSSESAWTIQSPASRRKRGRSTLLRTRSLAGPLYADVHRTWPRTPAASRIDTARA
mmetsp:Transcript_17220/g.61172  ORF Transcript_17220/g.61172 Transcript_17220/m.61172 type:complete len:281 (+) Transcript_17220:148-990(+)